MNCHDVYFRAGVGIILHREGKVALFERSDHPGSWQFPQGGMQPGESPTKTMWRELWEETGIQEKDCLTVHPVPFITSYVYPNSTETSLVGQSQFWFIIELNKSVSLDLSQAQDQEFTKHQWIDPPKCPGLVVPFKGAMYAQLINYWNDLTI